MPEGDTVWRTARRLDEALSGRVLDVADLRVPRLATTDLVGRTVESTASRGKHLLTRIGDLTLHTHLKMEGAWHVLGPGERWRRPAHTVRVVLGAGDVSAVGFSLGVVELVPRDEETALLAHLGPDLLAADWDPEAAVARVAARPERPVFDALLDQRNLAGLGNEYVTELLFTAGLLPTRPVGDVPDLRRLVVRAHAMIMANRDRVDRTFTGDTRRGRTSWAHGREHRSCRRCHTPLETAWLGQDPARQRLTTWCPRCQT